MFAILLYLIGDLILHKKQIMNRIATFISGQVHFQLQLSSE